MKSIKKTYPRKGKNELYSYYRENSKSPVAEDTFKRVIDKFNQRIISALLSGDEFNPGNNLGRFRIIRAKRNFNKPQVNWKLSNEYKKYLIDNGYQPRDDDHPDGHNWLVFYTDRYYYRFYWRKQASRVPNKSAYRFDPTDTNKRKLSDKAKNSKAFEMKIPTADNL